MKNKATFYFAAISLVLFASCISKSPVVDHVATAPITAETGKAPTPETVKAIGWKKIGLPDDYFVQLVTFGEAGEIVVIGEDIRTSKDDGKTWQVISEGIGYDRCTLDGGKTFDKDCETDSKKPVKLNMDEVYSTSVLSAILAPDGRLYLSTFYEHHGALWSIPLNDPKELWYGLHFTYKGEPEEAEYWTNELFIGLKNTVYIAAASRTERFWLTTIDQGRTWHPADINMSSDEVVADENTRLRINDGTIEKTTDGGTSWTILVSSKTPDHTFSSTFIDNKKGFAGGEKGALSITEDGGISWKKIELGITETFYGVAMLDQAHAWAYGDKGMILETSDGGQNWQFLDFGQARDTSAMFNEHDLVIDKKRGAVWLVLNGKIFRRKVG